MGDAQSVWLQKTVTLKPYRWVGKSKGRKIRTDDDKSCSVLFCSVLARPCRRGCHVVTRELTSQLGEVENMSVGLANFFIQHTSASLTMYDVGPSAILVIILIVTAILSLSIHRPCPPPLLSAATKTPPPTSRSTSMTRWTAWCPMATRCAIATTTRGPMTCRRTSSPVSRTCAALFFLLSSSPPLKLLE